MRKLQGLNRSGIWVAILGSVVTFGVLVLPDVLPSPYAEAAVAALAYLSQALGLSINTRKNLAPAPGVRH